MEWVSLVDQSGTLCGMGESGVPIRDTVLNGLVWCTNQGHCVEWVSLVDQSGTLCGMGDTGGPIRDTVWNG